MSLVALIQGVFKFETKVFETFYDCILRFVKLSTNFSCCLWEFLRCRFHFLSQLLIERGYFFFEALPSLFWVIAHFFFLYLLYFFSELLRFSLSWTTFDQAIDITKKFSYLIAYFLKRTSFCIFGCIDIGTTLVFNFFLKRFSRLIPLAQFNVVFL